MKTAVIFLALSASAFAVQPQTEMWWAAGQIEGALHHAEQHLYHNGGADLVDLPLHQELWAAAAHPDATWADVARLARRRDEMVAAAKRLGRGYVPVTTEY